MVWCEKVFYKQKSYTKVSGEKMKSGGGEACGDTERERDRGREERQGGCLIGQGRRDSIPTYL